MAALNINNEIFVIYVVLSATSITILIYFSHQDQVASLTKEKTGIFVEYSDFFDVFFSDSVTELLEYTKINDYRINLLDNKQLPYGLT